MSQQTEEHKKMHEDWAKAIGKAERQLQKKADTHPTAAAGDEVVPDIDDINDPWEGSEDTPEAPGQSEEPDIPRRLYCDKCLLIADSPKRVVSGNIREFIASVSDKKSLQIDLGHLKKCDTRVENCLRLSGPEVKEMRKDRANKAKAAKTKKAKGDPPQEAPPARTGNKPRGKSGKGTAAKEEASAPDAVEDGGGGSGEDTPAEEESPPPVPRRAGRGGKAAATNKVEKPAKATRSKGATKAAEPDPTATTSEAPARKAAGRPKKKTATEAEAQGQEPTEAGPAAAPTMGRRGRSGRRNKATTAAPAVAPVDGEEEAAPPADKDEVQEPGPAAIASNVQTTKKRTTRINLKVPG